jgi:hypothetical protein
MKNHTYSNLFTDAEVIEAFVSMFANAFIIGAIYTVVFYILSQLKRKD